MAGDDVITYQYQAYEKSGKLLRGVLQAENAEKAASALREKGIYVAKLRAGGRGIGRARRGNAKADRLFFLRQLATLLQGGRSLEEALGIAGNLLPEGTARSAALDVRERVRRGESISAALKAWPQLFSPFHAAMALTGEESGNLPAALRRLAEHEEKEQALKSKIVSAAGYPAFVALFSLGVVLFLFAYMIPTIRSVTDDMGGTLPWITRLLFGVSDLLRVAWVPGAIAVLGGLLLLIRFSRTVPGKRKIDAALLRLPWTGDLIARGEAGRFCAVLATMTGSGMELVRSLETAAGIFRNSLFQEWGKAAREKIVRGAPLSRTLGESPLFPEMVPAFVRAGEESGSLTAQLESAGKILEEEVERRLKRLTTFLEPALIILVGILVGAAVLAVVLPIVQLNTFVQ